MADTTQHTLDQQLEEHLKNNPDQSTAIIAGNRAIDYRAGYIAGQLSREGEYERGHADGVKQGYAEGYKAAEELYKPKDGDSGNGKPDEKPDDKPEKPDEKPDKPTFPLIKLPEKDFEGTPITHSEPVVLPAVPVAKPRLRGNDYDLAEQQAKFIVNLGRFPEFESHPKFPFVNDQPFFTPVESFPFFTRGGYTHAFVSAKARKINYFGAVNLPREQRAIMMNDAQLYEIAGIWANRLAQQVGEADERVIRLREFHKGPVVDGKVKHRMIIHQATIDYLAPFVWDDIKTQSGQGNGVDLVSFDIESHQYPAWENRNSTMPVHNQRISDQYRMVGMLYLAVGKLAAAEGKPIRMMVYYDGLIEAGGKLWNGERKEFLSNYVTGPDANRPYSSSTHPFIQALATLGGFVGNGNYMRCTWSNESWYDKDAQGNYILENGVRRTRTTDHTATLFGQQISFKGIDPRSNNQTEAMVAMMWANYALSGIQSYQFALNDGKPRRRFSEKASVFRSVEMAEYIRHDTETLSGNPGNEFGDRPTNPDLLEFAIVTRSAFTGQWPWSAEGPYEFGAAGKGGIPAKGPMEVLTKARHRAMNILNAFFRKHSDYWLGFPFQNYINEFGNDPNRPNGALAQRFPPIWVLSEGRDLVVCAAYIAQDVNEVRELVYWHVKAPEARYTAQLKGRKTYLEWVVLPESITDCDPKDLRFEYTDLIGTKRMVSGDWHYPVK